MGSQSAIVSFSDIKSPLVREGYDYWLRKRSNDAMPARSNIDPPLEVPHLCSIIILQEIRRDPLDFRYRLVGSTVRSHLQADRTGCWMSGLEFQRSPNPIWFAHASVAETGDPIFLKPPYVGPHADFLDVEGVVLPLAEDRRTPDRLILFVAFTRLNANPGRLPPQPLRSVGEGQHGSAGGVQAVQGTGARLRSAR
jgi:hypothetical protein